jgi:hypothetical protein
MNVVHRTLLFIFTLWATSSAHAATLEPVDHVVELFTSQACSSCPPADTLLADFAKAPNLLALSYHVDYWNNLGWVDALAIPSANERQQAYAAALGSKVFTPQMVVNGQEQFVGSHEDDALAALARPAMPGSLALQLDGNALHLNLPATASDITAWLVTYRWGTVQTDVKSGENAGRKLVNTNPVIDIRPLPAAPVTGVYVIPNDVLESVDINPTVSYAVIVQHGSAGIILAAAKLVSSQ